MPVRSKAQWGFLAVNHPELLRKWQKEAPVKMSELPSHAPNPPAKHGAGVKEQLSKMAPVRSGKLH